MRSPPDSENVAPSRDTVWAPSFETATYSVEVRCVVHLAPAATRRRSRFVGGWHDARASLLETAATGHLGCALPKHQSQLPRIAPGKRTAPGGRSTTIPT